jgi:hypothetical protein
MYIRPKYSYQYCFRMYSNLIFFFYSVGPRYCIYLQMHPIIITAPHNLTYIQQINKPVKLKIARTYFMLTNIYIKSSKYSLLCLLTANNDIYFFHTREISS